MRPYIFVLFAFIFLTSAAMAQYKPFLFTMTPTGVGNSFAHYDAAYGQHTFEPFGADNVEQNLGLQAGLGENFSLAGYFGLALGNGSSSTTEQGEFIANLLKAGNMPVDFSAGLGFRHEYSGTDVLLGGFILGRQFNSSALYGNLLLEKAFAANRDDIDLTTTIGFSQRLSSSINVGIEAVGQDLEGFWTPDESEGGAVIFVGPSSSIYFPGTNLNLVIGGGPIIRATYSSRTSSALRDLPTNGENGFVIRTMLCLGL